MLLFYISKMLNNKYNKVHKKFEFNIKFYQIKVNKFMSQPKDKFSVTKSTNISSANATLKNWLQDSDTKNPQQFILHNYQYTKLYDQFLKDNKQLQAIVKASKEEKQQQSIKSFLSRSLSMKQKRQEFEDKFSSEFKMHKHKPVITMLNTFNTITQKIGQTEKVMKQNEKKLFFSQTRKVLKLEEDCLLLEYYYKDKSQFYPKNLLNNKPLPPSNISYLRSRNSSEAKHKRNQPNKMQSEKLYLTHNQPYIEKRKAICFVKEEKFKNQCYNRAEMNYQFKREKNFAQMAEITKQNRQNLLIQNSMNLSQNEIKQKQLKFIRVMRFFLKFAFIEQTKRAYYDYIDTEGMQKLTRYVIDNELTSKLTEHLVSSIIQKIIKYKQQKRLQFYDFVEFLDTISDTLSINLLQLIQEKYPNIFIKIQQKYLNENWQQIKKEMNANKIKFTIKLIFESARNHLVLGRYLPIKQIPRVLSRLGISGNDVSRAKLFEILYWNQHRAQGLSFHEFYFAFLMLGVRDNSYQHVFHLINKIKLAEILQ